MEKYSVQSINKMRGQNFSQNLKLHSCSLFQFLSSLVENFSPDFPLVIVKEFLFCAFSVFSSAVGCQFFLHLYSPFWSRAQRYAPKISTQQYRLLCFRHKCE